MTYSIYVLEQGGVVEDQGPMINYGWKMDVPEVERREMEKSMMRMYSHEWMMMMEMPPSPSSSSTTPCCNNINRPLKTLQLFPISATPNLKEDSTTTT